MSKKNNYRITFQKNKFLIFDVEADNKEEAIEIANLEDEKFGAVIETPYFLSSAFEEDL